MSVKRRPKRERTTKRARLSEASVLALRPDTIGQVATDQLAAILPPRQRMLSFMASLAHVAGDATSANACVAELVAAIADERSHL